MCSEVSLEVLQSLEQTATLRQGTSVCLVSLLVILMVMMLLLLLLLLLLLAKELEETLRVNGKTCIHGGQFQAIIAAITVWKEGCKCRECSSALALLVGWRAFE